MRMLVEMVLLSFYMYPVERSKTQKVTEVSAAWFNQVFKDALSTVSEPGFMDGFETMFEFLQCFDAVCCDIAQSCSVNEEVKEHDFRSLAHSHGVVPKFLKGTGFLAAVSWELTSLIIKHNAQVEAAEFEKQAETIAAVADETVFAADDDTIVAAGDEIIVAADDETIVANEP